MQQGKRRIALLKRVARLREIEKRQAAARLAEAQGMHGKLLALESRSGEIAASYAARRDAVTAGDLARQRSPQGRARQSGCDGAPAHG